MCSLHCSVRYRRTDGVVAVLVAVALAALLGAVALAIDVGAVVIKAQSTQGAVDAAALAATIKDISVDPAGATARANSVITSNATETGTPLAWTPGSIQFYYSGDTVPGFRQLTGYEEAVTLSAREPVKFNFAPILGLNSTTVVRNATAARLFTPYGPMLPMWVGAGTQLNYGVTQDLHQTDTPGSDPRVPGNFGWLVPPSGQGDFDTLLCGYNVPEALMLANYMHVGDVIGGLTGQKTGHWMQALGTGGTGRLERCTWAPWTLETTFPGTRKDNPRIVVVPLVEWVGYSGSNALWKVDGFAVFWLESVRNQGQDKIVRGRFVDYATRVAEADTWTTSARGKPSW